MATLSLQEWNISTDIFAQSDGLSDLYGQSDLYDHFWWKQISLSTLKTPY